MKIINMKNITMIAAVGENLELGKNNKLIWPIKEDLHFFRNNTINKPIVMGRNTLESLPRLLPKRKHIVLTTNTQLTVDKSVQIYHNIEEVLKFIEEYKEEVMIIGGASIYKQFLEYASKLLLTEIAAKDSAADAYFPEFNKNEWERKIISEHEENNIKYKHLVYTRK